MWRERIRYILCGFYDQSGKRVHGMLRSEILMSIMRDALSVPTSSELQAEAAQVERLRRQIAEMPAKGESVSPQMLAEFARAQKSYLDRKIEFEKLKRTESGILKMPSAVREVPEPTVDPGVPVPASLATPLSQSTPPPVAADVVAETPQPSKVPVPPLPTKAKPAKSPMMWVIGVVVVVALGAAAVLMLR
jgi:hypothetical protein